jgi:hypothetical protein
MIHKNAPKQPRPYWYVDFKWLFGIFAVIFLGASLLLFNLAALTERSSATTISATLVASMFSPEGLNDDKGIEELKKQIESLSGDVVVPIEAFPWLHISKNDIIDLSPRDLRIFVFKQMTEPIYDKGLEAFSAEITSNKSDQKEFINQAFLLRIFTKSTHDILQTAFYITLTIAIACVSLVAYFSSAWGRLVSVSVLFILSSLLGAIVGLIMRTSPSSGYSPFSFIPQNILSELSGNLVSSYGLILSTGFGLLMIAAIGKIVQVIVSHKKQ